MTDDGRKGQSLCPGWSTLATTSTSPWAQLILTSSSTQPQWHCWYLVRFPSLRFRGRMNGLRWEVALGAQEVMRGFLAVVWPDTWWPLVTNRSEERGKTRGSKTDTRKRDQADCFRPIKTVFAYLHQTKQLLPTLGAWKKTDKLVFGSLSLHPIHDLVFSWQTSFTYYFLTPNTWPVICYHYSL